MTVNKSNPLPTLVLGSDGQLGREIFANQDLFSAKLFFLSKNECDITDRGAIEKAINQYQPRVVLNLAAYTAVDKAETEQEQAFLINASACKTLGEICCSQGVSLVHISTDYVFDGNTNHPYDESAPTNPLGVYGASKLTGEQYILASGACGAIIRTSWLYSAHKNNFVKTILKKAQELSELKVVDDQIGTPTWTFDLVRAIAQIILKPALYSKIQVYHFSNEGVASWYDFACAILEYAGIETRVMPVSTAEYITACKRPAFTVLSKGKIKKELEIIIPHWRQSLKHCLLTLGFGLNSLEPAET